MQRIIETILDSIIDTSVLFLENDMSINVLQNNDDFIFEDNKYHISAINFDGKLDLICILYIDDRLLKSIYKIFFSNKLNRQEEQEMLKELPKEVLNIVAGLSISKFPAPYGELVMSLPFDTDNTKIKNLSSHNLFLSKSIKTDNGLFTCKIISK